MISVLLDSNIYDKLAADGATCERIRALIKDEKMKIIVTRTVREELRGSPFKGVPDFFPVEHSGNTVGRVGIMRVGDRLGSGDVYYAHRGKSKSDDNDAFIADAASSLADWMVSEDRKMRNKATRAVNDRCLVLDYKEFVGRVANL